MLGELPLLVNIVTACEGLHVPYTSILCHPLFSELFLKGQAHVLFAIIGSCF